MLLSRDALLSALFCETDRAQRMKTPLALVYFGIDQPGELHSRFGSSIFEDAIEEIARRVSKILRCYDSIGRIAETEFLILLPGCTAPNAVTFAERLRAVELGRAVLMGNTEVHLSASFGIAGGGRSPLIVLREAQSAFRRARSKGAGSIERCRILDSGEVSAIPVLQDEALHW